MLLSVLGYELDFETQFEFFGVFLANTRSRSSRLLASATKRRGTCRRSLSRGSRFVCQV